MITSMVWQSDVDLVIHRLSADKLNLKDRDFFYQTVDQIEEMKTPDGKQRLTLDELEAWEERCREGEQTDGNDTTDHTAKEDNQNRFLRHARTVINPMPLGPVHQHGE
jgi:lipoate-protein ligase A